MNQVEQRSPGYGPAGLATAEGLSWGRSLSMVFALAVSVALGWSEQPPADRAGVALRQPDAVPALASAIAAPAAPVAAAAAAVPPATRALAAPDNGDMLHAQSLRDGELASAAAPARVVSTSAGKPHLASKRHLHRHAALGAAAPADIRPAGAKGNAWANPYKPLAYASRGRTRAEVRNEFLASRQEVAAFTGEDSGSAYLTQLVARRNAALAQKAAHSHGRDAGGAQGRGAGAYARRGAQAATG